MVTVVRIIVGTILNQVNVKMSEIIFKTNVLVIRRKKCLLWSSLSLEVMFVFMRIKLFRLEIRFFIRLGDFFWSSLIFFLIFFFGCIDFCIF